MNPTDRIERAVDPPFTKLDGQILLVVAKTREVHLLNESAARIWELLETGTTLEALKVALQEEYEMDPVTGAQEIEAAVAEMAEKGLVKTTPQ